VKFAEIPKFVINLKKRPERLESTIREMKYMDWDFEVFEAIDLDSHVGCTHSHLAIFDIAEERGYEKVMIMEDDNFFMPYAHDLVEKIESVDFDFDYMNLSPTLNRKITKSDNHPFLYDLTKISDEPIERGIFAANCVIYDRKVFDKIRGITGTTMANGRYYYAFDTYVWRFVIPEFKSFTPILPISAQQSFYSDISGGNYNNFHTQTYQWQTKAEVKIPGEFMNIKKCREIKDDNKKIKLEF